MADITVRVLGEKDWQLYQKARLASLEESPEAFVADHATEAAYDESLWRDRMNRSDRLVAEAGGEVVAVASVRPCDDVSDEVSENAAEVFGLWVAPSRRGTGVAEEMLRAAVDDARGKGARQLVYWVGTDNARGVAFATSYGFRPTELRRPVTSADPDGSEEEIALVLSLTA